MTIEMKQVYRTLDINLCNLFFQQNYFGQKVSKFLIYIDVYMHSKQNHRKFLVQCLPLSLYIKISLCIHIKQFNK